MFVRRAMYWWLFPAAIVLPVWLMVGWGIFGSGGWTFVGLLIVCPVLFVALLAVAGIIVARGSVRAARAVSWRDVGILAAWHLLIIGFGLFGPYSGWFALAGILAGLAAFWLSLWELFRETTERIKVTFDAYEQAARPPQVSTQPSFDAGEFIVVKEARD